MLGRRGEGVHYPGVVRLLGVGLVHELPLRDHGLPDVLELEAAVADHVDVDPHKLDAEAE